jgi:hypothetical protein
MTINARRYLFGGIVLVCLILISFFVLAQFVKVTSGEKTAFSRMQGYVLTTQGIEKVEQNGDVLNNTLVLSKENIVTFDVLNADTLVYSTLLDPNDDTKINVYAYNLKTKNTQTVFESSVDNYYMDMYAVDKQHVGAIENIEAENTRKIVLFNVLSEEKDFISSPAKENFITTWVPAPNSRSVTFKGVSDDVYYYDRDSKQSNIIGTFDNVYGYLNDDTIWLTNIEDTKKMSIFNVKSQQIKAVDFSSALVNKTFIHGTLLSTGSPEKVLWVTSGFFDAINTASQRLITTDGQTFETLYDLSNNGYKFLDTTVSFDESKKIMAIAVTDKYGNNAILIMNVSDGKLLTTISGTEFKFIR